MATLSVVFCLSFSSCVKEEKDLFDKSAAERMNEALAKYNELLESSANGWVMAYYPYDATIGGLLYTVKFHDGKVDMASQEDVEINDGDDIIPSGEIKTSMYRIISEQGPILTFDTYAPMLHYYTEPKGSSNTQGFQGDYEFTFMEATDDKIILRGKKYGNTMTLTRMPEGEDLSSYIAKSLEMSAKIESVCHPKAVVNGSEYFVTMGGSVYASSFDDEEFQTSYVITKEGIEFYKPVTIGGVEFQSLFFDEATENLTSENNDVVFPYPTAMEQFCYSNVLWKTTFNSFFSSGSMDKTTLDLLKTANASTYFSSNNVISWCVGKNDMYPSSSPSPYCMYWLASIWGIFNDVIYKGLEMNIEEASSNVMSFGNVDDDYLVDGMNLFDDDYSSIFSPLYKHICQQSPYKVEFDDDRKPTTAKVISTADNGETWVQFTKVQ